MKSHAKLVIMGCSKLQKRIYGKQLLCRYCIPLYCVELNMASVYYKNRMQFYYKCLSRIIKLTFECHPV